MEGRTGAKLLYMAACALLLPTALLAQGQNCVPSCAPDDGRFLAITDGAGLDTLTDTTLDLQVRSPGGSFEIGFFDGETSGLEGDNVGLWDVNTGPDPLEPGNDPYDAQLTFNLFADPGGDGTGTVLVATWDGEAMADNDWTSFLVDNDEAALSLDDEYVYILRAELGGELLPAVRSVFKVRTSADVLIEVFQQPFSFAGSLPGPAELDILYPDCVGLTPVACLPLLGDTTYNGDFPFYLTVREPQSELLIWDGDLDRGDYNGLNPDTDDFNTANDFTGLPPFACVDPSQPCTADGGTNPRLPGVEFEGIAMGLTTPFMTTGNPPDDADPTGVGAVFVRPGSVTYEVWGPGGKLLAVNDNPSGNREWELFRIATEDDGLADAVVEELPAGLYEVRVKNLDLENLNAFLFSAAVTSQPTCQDGRPTSLTFTYTGDSCADPDASDNRQGGVEGTSGDYECSGPLDGDQPVRLVATKKAERFDIFPDLVYPGQPVTILSKSKNDKLFPHTELQLQTAGGSPLQDVTIHTSCSQPLEIGDQFGSLKLSNFSILYGK